jgi:hypothetical protein
VVFCSEMRRGSKFEIDRGKAESLIELRQQPNRQWRSQDLHMEGVGRATGTASGRDGGGSGRGSPPPGRGVRGYYPEKFLEI